MHHRREFTFFGKASLANCQEVNFSIDKTGSKRYDATGMSQAKSSAMASLAMLVTPNTVF